MGIGSLEHLRDGQPLRRPVNPCFVLVIDMPGRTLTKQHRMPSRRTYRVGRVSIAETQSLLSQRSHVWRFDKVTGRFQQVGIFAVGDAGPALVVGKDIDNVRACYFRAFLAGNGDRPTIEDPGTDFIVAAGGEGEKNQIAKQQFIIELYHCVSMKKTAHCAVFSPLLTNQAISIIGPF